MIFLYVMFLCIVFLYGYYHKLFISHHIAFENELHSYMHCSELYGIALKFILYVLFVINFFIHVIL